MAYGGWGRYVSQHHNENDSQDQVDEDIEVAPTTNRPEPQKKADPKRATLKKVRTASDKSDKRPKLKKTGVLKGKAANLQ